MRLAAHSNCNNENEEKKGGISESIAEMHQGYTNLGCLPVSSSQDCCSLVLAGISADPGDDPLLMYLWRHTMWFRSLHLVGGKDVSGSGDYDNGIAQDSHLIPFSTSGAAIGSFGHQIHDKINVFFQFRKEIPEIFLRTEGRFYSANTGFLRISQNSRNQHVFTFINTPRILYCILKFRFSSSATPSVSKV